MTDDELSLTDVSGAALAAYSLAVNLARLLKERGVLDQEDINALYSGILLALEQRGDNPSAHAARGLLSAAAADQNVPLTKPN